MFIRQTRTNNIASGENYFTYRLVRGERIAGKVRQITLLNLGRHFPIKQQHWPLLCSRIEQLLQPQAGFLPIACPAHLERAAQRYVGQLIARAPLAAAADTPAIDASRASADAQCAAQVEPVEIDSLTLTQPRAVGVEHVALQAVAELGLVEKLSELGINGVMRACILGNLIGRIAQPASELATWNWLQTQSALGELLEVDFNSLSHMRLYRASDLLMQHREPIENHVFGALRTLFSLEQTVTLYDLTNTYFEGQAAGNPKAQNGRSKEMRSDCALLTLGLVLDGSGFVRRSRTFSGNVGENTTLEQMLTGLQAPPGALVIMDAGIATQANLDWLVEHGYRYLVVRRGGERQFDPAKAVSIETARGAKLRLHQQLSADGKEVQLYCHSEGRQAKETAMVERFTKGFEEGLQKIAAGLTKPRGEKRHDKLQERIGRLKQKSHGASQHYKLTLSTDKKGKIVTGLTWEKSLVPGTMATHPGVYCLRSNELAWDEAKLWGTYMMLTDLESVFRSLKSELGLRPVFHSKEDRSDGHLFITVLAYQCVQLLRTKLKAAGINESSASLRQTLCVQRRVTASMRRSDGRMVHVRKSTVAEPALMAIYEALGVSALPGGTRKLIC
jgi:transposase